MSGDLKFESPVSPHPGPLPRGEGEAVGSLSASAGAESELVYPEWHPCLPNLSKEEVHLFIRKAGLPAYVEWLNERTRRIDLAKDREVLADGTLSEPFKYGFETEDWKRADRLFRGSKKGMYVAGGKRSMKSERAAKRFVKAAMTFRKGIVWAMQANERTSITAQQSLVWKYLPNWVKALNSKARHGMAKVNYSLDGGFTEKVLVLPNETQIFFLTYNQDPKGFEGWQIGYNIGPRELRMMEADPELENYAAWLDEDATLQWVQTTERRATTRGGKILWTFSTTEGITMAVKEVLGTPKTLESRPAKHVEPKIRHVQDCPPGHMPYVQTCTRSGWHAIYFHTEKNPFGQNYQNMLELYGGKSFPIVAENLYGWSEDTRTKAFVKWGPWNIVPHEAIPAEGTNYMLADPGGARNWATIWARLCPGNIIYIYRDWPDEQRYGAWAEADPGQDPNPDGIAGRAQRCMGYGWARLKSTWLEEERIHVPESVKELVMGADGVLRVGLSPVPPHPGPLPQGEGEALGRIEEMLRRQVKDAHHRRAILSAIANGEDLNSLREKIHRRYIDPRAGKNQTLADHNATCAIDEFNKVHKDAKGNVIPKMWFEAAPGLPIDEGVRQVKQVLDWDEKEALCPMVNEPKLYVSERCLQVIWMMGNYTMQGGEKGGCKDFADLTRYLVTAKPQYLPAGALRVTGGGSY